ncbi:hypothetical protein ACOZ4L_07630 [Haloplanus ruber]|uniref:DUF5658 domain-containing protein n=1 Tax=Haloplanus ruber TaxID=869892 RepID=A0ABD6CUZ6_9EURY|nr:hypothetical protein [Haloplanus ruber]
MDTVDLVGEVSPSWSVERRDVHLWSLVIAAMLADIGLTVYGLQQGLLERNPILLFGLDVFGYAALAFIKVPALVIGVTGWFLLPTPSGRLTLVALAVPWIGAVGVNLWLIL